MYIIKNLTSVLKEIGIYLEAGTFLANIEVIWPKRKLGNYRGWGSILDLTTHQVWEACWIFQGSIQNEFGAGRSILAETVNPFYIPEPHHMA